MLVLPHWALDDEDADGNDLGDMADEELKLLPGDDVQRRSLFYTDYGRWLEMRERHRAFLKDVMKHSDVWIEYKLEGQWGLP